MTPKAITKLKRRKKRGHSAEDGESHQAKRSDKLNTPTINTPKIQALTPKPPKLPRGLYGPRGIKLKQLQYHKFETDIVIYHYAASFISIPDFRSLLTRQHHGYVNYLLGPDPLSSTPTPLGDESPPGCLEVGYLPSVFVLGGSALGFRVPSSPPTMTWLCFDGDIQASILDRLDVKTSTQHMLFEHVADLPRAPPAQKKWDRQLAYTEHKDWFESLREAGRRPFRLGLTWRTLGSEMMVEGMKKRDELVRLKERAMMGSGEAVDVRDAGDDYGHIREGGDEDGGQGIVFTRQRDTESLETVGRNSPLVYRDPVLNQPIASTRASRPTHSRLASDVSALSNRSTNTRQTQPLSSTNTKSKEGWLLDGSYI
ncbi:hypothetical protein G6011_07955 [Alternaria panax]|uniref:Uncharacterized protein n=1 Tax=Alternaria panax TaxID=48097 RepID=A0AAD4I6I5_9PLEO|nr:hypothetical protein G6011_07955 [Alternaria panax]